MNNVVQNMESLLNEADKAKGWKWVHGEPLWTTWSLERFGKYTVGPSATHESNCSIAVTSVSSILVPYHRSLDAHTKMVQTLRPHSVSFEASRAVIAEWINQEWLEDEGWQAKWEDLCEVEVDRWGQK
jgi:hypothetical protein